jgi:tRNA (guanine-N1)-methyltransferase
MRFDILTIFPKIFNSYLNESILKRAQKKKLILITIHDFRKFALGKHKQVDDRPYGGGPGMILKVEPIYKCLKSIKRKKKSKVILLTPEGKLFNQNLAQEFSKLEQIILICGRYEGFDERVRKYVDEEISVGPYVLSGGELPAMTLVETISRLISGVLGDKTSKEDETYSKGLDYVEYPQYTRPRQFLGREVPKILLSGNHQKIKIWRRKKSKRRKILY